MEKLCFVMKAMPGAGKSFSVRELMNKYNFPEEGHVFSTDNFWIPKTLELRKKGIEVPPEDEKKEYRANWTPNLLGKAHQNNLNMFKNAVDNGISPVVVDNCNVKFRDYKDYVDYALKNGYKVEIVEPSSPWWKEYSPYLVDKTNEKQLDKFANELFKRNQHGVPLETIKNMIKKWETV